MQCTVRRNQLDITCNTSQLPASEFAGGRQTTRSRQSTLLKAFVQILTQEAVG